MLSIDSSFIHFCVFSRLSNLKKSKEGKPVLYRKGPLTVIYASANQANQLVSFPMAFLEQMLSKSFPFFNFVFSPIGVVKLIKSHHIRSLANLVWETLNCDDYLWGFCGFFLLTHFLFLPTLFITLFPFLAHV